MADSSYDTKAPSLSLSISASDLATISDGVDGYITTNSTTTGYTNIHFPPSYSYYTTSIDTYSTPSDIWKSYDVFDRTIEVYPTAQKKEGDKKEMTDKKETMKTKWEKWDKSKFTPERIVYNPPATIVFWKDKTKTVVKCSEGEEYSEYFGFLAALGKKIFETNSEVNRIVNKYKPEPKPTTAEVLKSKADKIMSTYFPEPKPKAKPAVKKKKENKKK